MKLHSMILGLIMVAIMLPMSCNNDSSTLDNSPESLYAVIKPEEGTLIDIIPSDYVLTLNDIIAVNPETGEFKMKNTERIDAKSYPIPVQYVIMFYSNGEYLFSARLNSVLSSYMPSGLQFCHSITDKNGLARYDLGAVRIKSLDGTVEGELTDEQERGMKRLYQILERAGKVRSNIDYDFQFN